MSDIAAILERFWQLRALMLVALLIGVVTALATAFRISADPPFLESRAFTRGVASTEVLVDSRRSALTNVAYDLEALSSRTQVFVQLVSTTEVRERIAREAGLDPATLAVVPFVQRVPGAPSRDPTAGERSDEIVQELRGYRLEVRAAGTLPVLELTAQAPDADEAARLANAGARATISYLEGLGEEERTTGQGSQGTDAPLTRLSPQDAQVLAFGEIGFRQLGPARSSLVRAGGGIGAGVFAGALAFLVSAVVLYFLASLRREVLRRRRDRPAMDAAVAAD